MINICRTSYGYTTKGRARLLLANTSNTILHLQNIDCIALDIVMTELRSAHPVEIKEITPLGVWSPYTRSDRVLHADVHSVREASGQLGFQRPSGPGRSIEPIG